MVADYIKIKNRDFILIVSILFPVFSALLALLIDYMDLKNDVILIKIIAEEEEKIMAVDLLSINKDINDIEEKLLMLEKMVYKNNSS